MRLTKVFQVLILSLFFAGSVFAQSDFEATKKLAEQGLASAQNTLGEMYRRVDGVVPRDNAEAFKWYRLAVETNPAAPAILGDLYYKGEGVPQNNVQAYVWFSIAASYLEVYREFRDLVAAKLTPQDLSKAQAIATKCFESNYKDCE